MDSRIRVTSFMGDLAVESLFHRLDEHRGTIDRTESERISWMGSRDGHEHSSVRNERKGGGEIACTNGCHTSSRVQPGRPITDGPRHLNEDVFLALAGT